MKIKEFEWDEENEEHISYHNVTVDEAEEVFVGAPLFRKGRQGYYYAYGTTEEGRHLFVVFTRKGKGKARVVTARDMTDSERRYYRRK